MEIIVDYREAKLLAALEALGPSPIGRSNLELGDVVVQNGDVKLVFERKSFADLAASLKDGRYKEQKVRLLAHTEPRKITYLIEGMPNVTGLKPDQTYHGLSSNTITSMLIHTMFRDGIHVVFTKDEVESAKWIALVAKKLAAHPEKFGGNSGGGEASGSMTEGGASYVMSVKAKSCKKENIDMKTCYILQLCQIPSISQKIAFHIAARFASMGALIGALKACDDDKARLSMLRDIPLVGGKKALTIVKYILQPQEAPEAQIVQEVN